MNQKTIDRLTDRSFVLSVLATLGVWGAALKGVIAFQTAVEASQIFIGLFVGAEKLKDTIAVYSNRPAQTVPETVVAGGDANVSTEPSPDFPGSIHQPQNSTPDATPIPEPLPAFEDEAPVLGVRDEVAHEAAPEGELVILSDEEIARVAQRVKKELQG